MTYKVFSVYDSKVMAYLSPFTMDSVGRALRDFTDACNDPKTLFNKHPGDFQLYEIGTFDGSTGLMVAMVPMKLLGCAADFINAGYKDLAATPAISIKEMREAMTVDGSNGS